MITHFRSLAEIRVAAHCSPMSISSINADAFVNEVLREKQVWAIRDEGGFPTVTNASGETAMPLWSSKKRAMSIIRNVAAYRDFEPVPIALSEFVEQWLPGLSEDCLHCGLNWSGQRATGYDSPPADVLARLNAAQARP